MIKKTTYVTTALRYTLKELINFSDFMWEAKEQLNIIYRCVAA